MYKNLADKSFGLGICPYYDLSWLSRDFLLDLDRIRVSMLGDGFKGGTCKGAWFMVPLFSDNWKWVSRRCQNEIFYQTYRFINVKFQF